MADGLSFGRAEVQAPPAMPPPTAPIAAVTGVSAMPPDPRLLDIFRKAAAVAAALAALIGAIGFLGQLTLHPELASVRPDWVTMKANTGLMLFIGGAAMAIACLDPRARGAARAAGLVMTGVAVLTLLEYLLGWDLAIDDLFVVEPLGAPATVHPGRMAIITAVCFAITGPSMIAAFRSGLRLRWLSSAAALLPLLLGLTAALGYLFGADETYSWAGHITAIAAPTAMAFVLLSCALLLARVERGVLRWLASPSSGGVMLRRLLPVALLSPAAFAWLKVEALAFRIFHTPEFGAANVAVVTMVVFASALVWCAALLDGLDARRRAGEVRITRLNEELTQQVRALEGANRELEGFAYAMGHVLRAPLRAMDGFSRILLDDYGPRLDAEGVRMLGVVRSNATDMGLLIDAIGQFVRLGQEPLSFAETDMTSLARAALDALKPKMAGRDVQVVLPPLPSARADAAMLRRVWLQLLDNAVKFTAARPRALIEIGAAPGERETTYFVRDNGVGFAMKYSNKLWGVFNRLHGAEFAGDGMGLAIVQRIVLRHGGRVWAEGKPDEGATFYFSLPAHKESPHD